MQLLGAEKYAAPLQLGKTQLLQREIVRTLGGAGMQDTLPISEGISVANS